jgi:hypothetical protein
VFAEVLCNSEAGQFFHSRAEAKMDSRVRGSAFQQRSWSMTPKKNEAPHARE